jgi:hypothetical protein
LSDIKLTPDNYTYRVEFVGDTARVQCFGIPIHACAEFEEETVLPIAELPDWMTRRVAVLCTMSYEPPTEFVNKIGRRISNMFTGYSTKREDDDTREES